MFLSSCTLLLTMSGKLSGTGERNSNLQWECRVKRTAFEKLSVFMQHTCRVSGGCWVDQISKLVP